MNWMDFTTFVKEMRALQNETMKKQGGGNRIMVSVVVTDSDIYHTLYFMPHGIDLRSGIAYGFRDSGEYGKFNLREILKSYEVEK